MKEEVCVSFLVYPIDNYSQMKRHTWLRMAA